MKLSIHIKAAKLSDLDDINRVIEAAVMGWDLPERVKRLSLSSYHYSECDFNNLEIMVAIDRYLKVVGVVALEQTGINTRLTDFPPLTIHGFYVHPDYQSRGIGKILFNAVEKAARQLQYKGLIVKAHTSATRFFISQGMKSLEIENTQKDYPNQLIKII